MQLSIYNTIKSLFNMKYKVLIFTLLFLKLTIGFSQNLSDLKVIESKFLTDNREIKVLLPEDYSKEEKSENKKQ